MYVEYDPEVDGAFIWFVDDIALRRRDVVSEIWPTELNEEIGLLFDDQGKLLGVELQPATNHLEQAVLDSARRY